MPSSLVPSVVRLSGLLVLLLVGLVAGCGGPATPETDASIADAGRDAGPALDAPTTLDGGLDGGGLDGGDLDGGGLDGGDLDGGEADAGTDAASSGLPDSDLPDVMLADAPRLTCGGGQVDCGGVCTDLENDPESCGECGRTCYGPNVLAPMCADGSCSIISCDLLWADVNHSATDGCEAEQDFSIATVATAVVSAGGTVNVDVEVTRINGLSYPISIVVDGLPTSFTTPSADFTLSSPVVLSIAAPPGAPAAVHAARVVARVSTAGITLEHEVPLSVDVRRSPVTITDVVVRLGSVAMVGREVPQGVGEVTIAVDGTNLGLVTTAGLGPYTLTPAGTGTATHREWNVTLGHGGLGALARRADTLTLSAAGALTTFASAMIVTQYVVSPTGSDSNIGTFAAPFATLDQAFARAAARDGVVILAGTHEPAGRSAPSGLAFVRGEGADTTRIVGTSSDAACLALAGDTLVEQLHLEGCARGVSWSGATVAGMQDVHLADSSVAPLAVEPGTTLRAMRTVISGGGAVVLDGGTATLESVDSDASFEGAATHFEVSGSRFSAITGFALRLGAAASPHLVSSSSFIQTGTALDLRPGAEVDALHVEITGPSADAVVIDGAELRATDLRVAYGTANGIVMRGASPALTTTHASVAFLSTGLVVEPTSGTASVLFFDTLFAYNVVGVDVRNGVATTTDFGATARFNVHDNSHVGLRVAGGTTRMTAPEIRMYVRRSDATGIELVSGGGTLAFVGGGWDVNDGGGLVLRAAAAHVVSIGSAGSRMGIGTQLHPADGTFAIDDRRASGGVIDVRADFLGSSGAARIWTGTFLATRGSFSADVSPRDLACWFVAFGGGLRFL